MTDPSDFPFRRPKNSIFDLTLPGTPAPRRRLFGAAAAPEEPVPEPPAEPRIYHAPRTAVMDPQEAPLPPAALEQQLREVLGEAATEAQEDRFDITDHGSTQPILRPIPMPPDHARATQAMEVPPPLAEPFDEGTAAEWNPRWSRTPGMAAPAPAPAPRPFPWIRVLPWAGALVLLLSLAGLFLPMLPSPTTSGASSLRIPENLRPYVVRAEAGDLAAMRQLGLRYAYGLEAPLDRAQGIHWLAKAARGGSPAAVQELQALGVTLNPAGSR